MKSYNGLPMPLEVPQVAIVVHGPIPNRMVHSVARCAEHRRVCMCEPNMCDSEFLGIQSFHQAASFNGIVQPQTTIIAP